MNAPPLARWQEEFADAVLGEADGAFASRVEPAGPDAARRIAIYRRSVAANLVRALRGAYPVVLRLVGDAFFEEAARRHARAHPPACGDLNRYGEGFPAFLREYPHAAALPWLADVARLEWAVHEASMAGDCAPIDFPALSAVPAEAQGALVFSLHPSVRLVRSRHPILAIWEANQPDRDGSPDRDAGEDLVMAWREAGVVRAAALAPREADFLEAVTAGSALGEAVGEPDWDLAGFLARLAAHGILGAFRTEIPGASPPISA